MIGGAGGWPQGGGHGALSNVYGMGVDRVLQYKVRLLSSPFTTPPHSSLGRDPRWSASLRECLPKQGSFLGHARWRSRYAFFLPHRATWVYKRDYIGTWGVSVELTYKLEPQLKLQT